MDDNSNPRQNNLTTCKANVPRKWNIFSDLNGIHLISGVIVHNRIAIHLQLWQYSRVLFMWTTNYSSFFLSIELLLLLSLLLYFDLYLYWFWQFSCCVYLWKWERVFQHSDSHTQIHSHTYTPTYFLYRPTNLKWNPLSLVCTFGTVVNKSIDIRNRQGSVGWRDLGIPSLWVTPKFSYFEDAVFFWINFHILLQK